MTENLTADLEWDDHGVPQSRQFGDVYFSRENGIEESRYVFLARNRIAERIARLPAHGLFVVAETGFGTGLNFLCTWQQWQQSAPPGARLHYISVEKYPLDCGQLRQALALWPELATLTEQLLECYPSTSIRGLHALTVTPEIRLTLIFDDAVDAFARLAPAASRVTAGESSPRHGWSSLCSRDGLVDAWYLDGFAPAKNPQMWCPNLFALIARLSQPGATLATFTSAGHVRRALMEAGFSVTKVAGYGRKREMLCAEYRSDTSPPSPLSPPVTAWHLAEPVRSAARSVTIVGAGLAGCHTAYALACRGFEVTVVERAAPGSGGSGNEQGVLYTRFSATEGHLADFNLRAYLFAILFYHRHHLFAAGEQCGVLQLADSAGQTQTLQAIAAKVNDPALLRWLDQRQASEEAGLPLTGGALYFPRSGWLSPKAVCHRLLDHPRIRLITETRINRLSFDDSQWDLADSTGRRIHRSDAVVVACAHTAREFSQAEHIPVKSIPGQVSHARPNEFSRNLRTVLCGTGYLAPTSGGRHSFGATFRMDPDDLLMTQADHQKNLDMLGALSPGLRSLDVDPVYPGRVSARCTTPDYLPIVGPMAIADEMISRFSALRHNAKAAVDRPGAYWPGLFINVGHGAKGLTFTPICADIIGALLSGDLLPLSADLYQQLHPARFLMRALRRRKL